MKKRYLTWKECEETAASSCEMLRGWLKLGETIKIYGVPRGGIPAMFLVKKVLEDKFLQTVEIVSCPENAQIIVDDIVDSGATIQRMRLRNDKARIITLFKKENEWLVFPWEKGEEEGPVENVRRLIEFIGDDPNREGLIETPIRVLRSYEKLYGGYKQDPANIMKTFTEGACDNMVLLKGIEMYSTCEHHMLPFFGKCHIAYIPDGKVIGVSKLARLMEIYSRRLQIQERIGKQITAALETHLQPLGAACIIEAQHFCMTSRGVEKQNSVMVTSSLTGEFLKPEVRQELLSLIGRN